MIYKTIPKQFEPRFEIVSCYIESNGEILLLHRHEGKSEGGKWGVPAGKIEKGEDKYDAMVRELREETGLLISKDALHYLATVYVKYPAYDFIYHMFKTQVAKRPEIKVSEHEHQQFVWVKPRSALKMPLMRDLNPCIKMFYYLPAEYPRLGGG